ncbi:hypothetical protein [Pseudomaricurvus sp.]|uniref:hypothetical protein n=1 Tax=Pseudomaricurvus sp. TaxID=2004510 RepID=UPI003F6C4BED
MPDLFFPTTSTRPAHLCDSKPETLQQFLACNPQVKDQNQWLSPHVAYDMSGTATPSTGAILREMNQLPIHQRANLSACVADFGDETSVLAKFYDQHLAGLDLTTTAQNSNGLAGMGMTALGARTDSFHTAVLQYQQALVQLNDYHRVGRVAAQRKLELRNKVIAAYERLNQYYQQELRRIVPADRFTKNKGSALSNAERGITLAERPRGRGIHVATALEGQQISRFAKGIRYAGRGAIALDAGFRINTVHNTYVNGGDWQREVAVQSGGMTASALTGWLTGRAAFFALSRIALMATPWGWAFLIGSSIVTGAVLAYQADQNVQSRVGNLWDKAFR